MSNDAKPEDWRPLRILAIGSAGSTHVINRVRCFAERGHQVALLCEQPAGNSGIVELVPSAPPGQDVWVANVLGCARRILGKHPSAASDMTRLFLDFRRLVRRFEPDIVHVHYAYATWAWMAAAIGCKPLVVSVMGGDVLFAEQGSPTPRGIALTKQLLRSADLITAKSNFLIKTLDALGGYGRKAMRVVWGVDPEIFKPFDAGPLRRDLGLPEGARVVLSPKILQRFYNIDVLVAAMAKVVEVDPCAHLVLTEYGADPAYRAELSEQITLLGLRDKVTFAGHVPHDRMPLFYSLADVAVGIPNSDGLPQTLLEAMGCGVPNVIGRLDRYGEIVRDGESAIFADITPQGVADAVLQLLQNEELRLRIGARGREVVVSEANFRNDVARVEQAYLGLARKRRSIQLLRTKMLADVALYWLQPQKPLESKRDPPLINSPVKGQTTMSTDHAKIGERTSDVSIGDRATKEYWTGYNVTLHHQFKNASESLAYLHWRNDQYFSYIDHMPVSGFDNLVVLDYGCGPGHDLVGFSVYSRPKELIGADISPSSLAEAEARLRLHESPAKLVLLDPNRPELPFEDDYFDHIHTSGVLHHMPNIDLVLGELRRVLKPGGSMNVMVYNYDSLWMHLFVSYHKQIIEQQYIGLNLRQAFTKTTDSTDCPIADCYTPAEFIAIAKRNGLSAELSGVAISMHELIIAPTRFAAIQDRRLPEECRRFLLKLKIDERGYPTYEGQYAGIDACFRLRKSTA